MIFAVIIYSDDIRVNKGQYKSLLIKMYYIPNILTFYLLLLYILPALPVMVRFPPTVATKEITAHASLLEESSRDSTLGFANWITATLPKN